MLVTHVIEDLNMVLISEPVCATYEIALARYKNEVGGDITVQSVGSFNWDEEEFFLNPEGSASAYSLKERKLLTQELLTELESLPDIHSRIAYAREKVKFLVDGSVASLNLPLWGTGVHHGARLVYFYFGEPKPTA
jgi:hypothetical protein